MSDHPSLQDVPFERWRHIKEGGDIFVEEYLVRREAEQNADFQRRMDITPDPATASSAVDDLINSLIARLDVNRSGGSSEYQTVIAGNEGGVDRKGTDLQTFLIKETIPELCYMSKFAWVINNFTDPSEPYKTPYITTYRAEDIRNWVYRDNELVAVRLRSMASIVDESGFSIEEREVYRIFRLTDSSGSRQVETWLENADSQEIDVISLEPGTSLEVINIDEIPVVIFELSSPLLKKIDRIQIAVLNMESSDIDWLRSANLPLYVEQANGLPNLTKSADQTEEEDRYSIKLGSSTGRQYPMNANQPNFIAPPADPIRVSMEKQKELSVKCRDILKTTLSELKQASAESISLLGQGMEAGMFSIGTVLLLGEIKYARLFHKFLGKEEQPTITYPKKYELKTELERIEKAKTLKAVQKTIGSNIAKKHLEVQILQTLLEGKMPHDQYSQAVSEIMDSEFGIYDPETIKELVDSGIISRQLASISLGAPETDSEQAVQEHIRRIVAVQVSQTSGTGDLNPDPEMTEKVRKEAALEVRDTGAS